MTSLFQKPDGPQLLGRSDSLTVGDADALATLLKIPGSLRARWQDRYGIWLAASDVVVVSGVVAVAHILRFGNVTSGSLGSGYAYSAVSL